MVLEIRNVRKTYTGGEPVEAVKGASFSAEAGEFIAVMGPSGSGKSTLLHLLGGLDKPTSGSVNIGGKSLETMDDAELSLFRRNKLGFIFQFFNLLPTLTTEENIALPLLLGATPMKEIQRRVDPLIKRLGLESRRNHRSPQLSGGEMQRVAIARALVNDPVLVLADEPTGNLDSKNGAMVLEMLKEVVNETKRTLVMVTHDPKAAGYGTRLIQLKDGLIEVDRKISGGTV
jgi:putative ABC transport system ATP-binding protein